MMKIKNKGFTLIEIITATAIIGIIASFTVYNFDIYNEKAKMAVIEEEIETLENAVKMYYIDNGEWPVKDEVVDMPHNYEGEGYKINLTLLHKYLANKNIINNTDNYALSPRHAGGIFYMPGFQSYKTGETRYSLGNKTPVEFEFPVYDDEPDDEETPDDENGNNDPKEDEDYSENPENLLAIKDLPINSIIIDNNSSYNGNVIKWKVIGHNHYKNTVGNSNISNHTTLLTERLITNKEFDSPERNHPSNLVKSNGNNSWLHSNLRQWLNSEGDNWYVAQHLHDAPPTYIEEKGFLSNLSNNFKSQIVQTSIKSGRGQSIDKVFLPSAKELGGNGNTCFEEGKLFGVFLDNQGNPGNTSRIMKDISGNNQLYLTRSASNNNVSEVNIIDATGGMRITQLAKTSSRIPIMINLNNDVFVRDIGGNTYELVF